MSTTVIYSPTVIQAIFGQEFASTLKFRQELDEGHTNSTSSQGQQDDDIIMDGSSNSNPEIITSPQKNLEKLFKEQEHVEENKDGVKPNKSPRTASGVVPPTQQLTVDVGDPLLPIRNLFRKRAGLPIPQYFAQAPPPSDSFGELMNEYLQNTVAGTSGGSITISHSQEGRLGPKIVKFDVAAHFGSFVMSADRLCLTSQGNFGSVRANVCVFKGKWQYEIQLGSKGVMQLGWATLTSRFSQEKGVGDTTDSFAYDGNRLRKWNGLTASYGENWQTGDIIGCLIDMDEGTIEYHRNGKSLGQAFTNIQRGPGVAYFPAVSLAWSESITANFGATPLQFPVLGYFPIQSEIPTEDTKVSLLFNWLENTLRIFPTPEDPSTELNISREDYETLLIIINRIFQFLAPSMNSAFIMEQTFLPFYARMIGLPEKVMIQDQVLLPPPESHVKVHLLLDLMWTFLEEIEMKKCIERMCIVFMNCFRSNSLSLAYPFQIFSLRCLIAMSSHRRSRRHLIHHILFDQIKLMHFLHIRPVDDEILKTLIPNSLWIGKSGVQEAEILEHKRICDSLRTHIQAVEEVQMLFVRTLLTNSDGSEKRPSSRSVFLRKFRVYIRDSIRPGSLVPHPMNRALCAFFRVLKIAMLLWKEEVDATENFTLPDFPSSIFYDMTIDYQDVPRVGGVANYLYKTYHAEVSTALNVPDYIVGNAATVHVATPIPNFFGIQDFAGLTIPMGSLSSPTISSSADENGSSETQSRVTSIFSTGPAENVPSDNAAGVSRVTIGAGASSVFDSISLGVGASASLSVPQPSTSLSPTLSFVMDEAFLGNRTPQVGVIHPPPATAFTTLSHTENVPDHRTVSVTSSAEDMLSTVPRMTALIAGTTSGTNLMIPVYDLPRDTAFQLLPGGFLGFSRNDRVGFRPNNPATALIGRDSGAMDPKTSLRELLDDTIMIFSCGVKKYVEKIVTLRRNTEEYAKALAQAKLELSRAGISELEKIELEKSVQIFTTKLEEQSRHIAWVESGVFTTERQRLSFELLKVVLKTLKNVCSQGILFAFVPDFYMTTLIDLTWLILTQFHPTIPYTNLAGIDEVLCSVAEFVATHFTDHRIASADTKDTLVQALSAFICDQKMLNCLEQIPEMSKKRMVKSLLRPYENRAWAQSNWMLLRIWQGSGFAFRYPNTTQARKAFRSRPNQDEYGISTNLPPTPSIVFQQLIASVLIENPRLAANYIHSVLNQLNWSFSEFVGLLQEIYTGANRNDRTLAESRQLKICYTCHELTQALLRVLEMVIQRSPQVLLDFKRESSEILLNRLCVLLSQVLNRIGTSSGTFAEVIELGISGIENISYFPILSSVAGIIIALIELELGKTDSSTLIATKALLQEPSFQVTSLDFLVGRNIPANTSPVLQFSLQNYVPDDVTESEIIRFEAVMRHVNDWAPRLDIDNESISDDEVCTICYAYAKSTTFKPCNHRSCRTCILHHLMNRGECFFCKGVIEQVIDDEGKIIHDVGNALPETFSDSDVTIASID